MCKFFILVWFEIPIYNFLEKKIFEQNAFNEDTTTTTYAINLKISFFFFLSYIHTLYIYIYIYLICEYTFFYDILSLSLLFIENELKNFKKTLYVCISQC